MNDLLRRTILSAIKESETESQRLEFKKRIELRAPAGKAEFIRDSIALLNSDNESPRYPGYLIVGVKKGKVFDISSENYDGATFREINRAYITPEPEMHYHEFSVSHRGRVGVIEFVPDPEAIYLAKRDLLSESGEKLMAAGQSWKRTGDQKISLSGDEILSRIGAIISRAQIKAVAPLQRRLAELEQVLTQSGPVPEVTRIGYVIEMESSWWKIADELPKLIPYLRDYRATAGPVVVRIMQDLVGRLSGGTPLNPLRSLTGVFRGLLATSSFEDAIALEGKTLSDGDEWLIRQTVVLIGTMLLDALVRLKRPEIVEVFYYLLTDTCRFALEHKLIQTLHEVEAAYEEIRVACDKADHANIKRLSRLFSVEDERKGLEREKREYARLKKLAKSRRTQPQAHRKK
jgi:hypothetical protein